MAALASEYRGKMENTRRKKRREGIIKEREAEKVRRKRSFLVALGIWGRGLHIMNLWKSSEQNLEEASFNH